MVRILGNSPERVKISDLSDVIYYRQVKDYSDQEFESKDLQKALRKGLITVLEKFKTSKGSVTENRDNGSVTVKNVAPTVSLNDIKRAVREVMPDMKSPGGKGDTESVREVLRDLVPMIVDTVRQEVSAKLSTMEISGGTLSSDRPTSFKGGDYVPEISTEGMISNIEIEAKQVSGKGVESNLDALRRLRK